MNTIDKLELENQVLRQEIKNLNAHIKVLHDRLSEHQQSLNALIATQSELLVNVSKINDLVGHHHQALNEIEQLFFGDGK